MSVNLDGVVACTVFLVAVSAGAQGITETIKNMIPWLMKEKIPGNQDNAEDVSFAVKLEGLRQGILKFIACASATLLITLSDTNPLSLLMGKTAALTASQLVAWGLMSSFGAPFLNAVLKILLAVREAKENLPVPAHKTKTNQEKVYAPKELVKGKKHMATA